MKDTKKAMIYCRQSSGSDDFSDSVENQIANCQKLADKEGISVIGTFQDLNTSGKTYPTGAEETAKNDIAFQKWYKQQTGTKMFRTGLGELLKHLKDVDYVIVDEMTRLYRPVTRSFLESYINEMFTDAGVTVLQVKGGKIDLSKFDQSLIQTLKNAIQDEAIANQKAKSKQQFRKMKDSGFYPNGGGKAFATRYDIATKKITVNDDEAEVVRYVFDEIEKYVPYLQIITEVNKRWKHLFKRCFYESSLYHIAKNPLYAGYQFDTHGLLVKNQQIDRPVITFEQYQKVQSIMESKRKNPPKAKFRWLPFSGLLYCGNCGSKLVSQTDKTGTCYLCNAGINLKKDDACRKSRVVFTCRKDFYVGLKEAIAPLLVLSLFKRIDDEKERRRNAENLEALKVNLANMESKQKQVTGMFLKGLLTDIELENNLVEFRQEINNLKSKITMAENASAEISETKKQMEQAYRMFQAMKLTEGEIPNDQYEQMLKDTVKRIDVFDTEIKITTVYGAFTLSRWIYKNHRNFPVPELKVFGKTIDNMTCRLTYRTGKKQGVLATFGKLVIESI